MAWAMRQRTFRENGHQVWPAIAPFAFAGPDGMFYRRNEFTREDPLSARYRVLDWLERQSKAADEPPPDPAELYWQAIASGQFLPGSHNGRLPSPAPLQPFRPVAPVEPTPIPPRLRGRHGDAKTRDLNNRIGIAMERMGWTQTDGLPRKDREDLQEEYIPNPLTDFDRKLDGRKGAIHSDSTFELPTGRMARIQTMTVNRKTDKPTLQELDTLLRLWKSVGDNVYGIAKTHQLRNWNRDRRD